MIFIGLVIIACVLYILDYKVVALVCFFFFMTSGFNLIPEEAMDIGIFSKGMDYAILILVGMIIVDTFCIKDYLKPDKFLWMIFIFYAFLAVCIVYNKFVIGTSWVEIIRTARYNVLWLAYLVFRNLPKERLHHLLKCLFLVTVLCATLYLLQISLNKHILNEGVKNYVMLFGMKIPRFYNQPDMLQIFTFLAIYFNPYKGPAKIITTTILIAALLGAFHRSLFFAFIFAISIGYVIRLPRIKKVVALTSITVVCFVFIAFFGYKFAGSRTVIDVTTVISGNVAAMEATDIDIEDLQNSTFTFRIVHLLERNKYLLEHPKAMLLGAGLMTEDSKLTDSMFDFDIGLVEETMGKTVQLDTPDISYSVLFMRYGYFGTLLILSLYIFLLSYFYKNRKDTVGLFSFVHLTATMVITFSSHILAQPISFLLPLITYHIVQKSNDGMNYIEEFKSLKNAD